MIFAQFQRDKMSAFAARLINYALISTTLQVGGTVIQFFISIILRKGVYYFLFNCCGIQTITNSAI